MSTFPKQKPYNEIEIKIQCIWTEPNYIAAISMV